MGNGLAFGTALSGFTSTAINNTITQLLFSGRALFLWIMALIIVWLLFPEIFESIGGTVRIATRRFKGRSAPKYRVTIDGESSWMTGKQLDEFMEWSGLQYAGTSTKTESLVLQNDEGGEMMRAEVTEFSDEIRREKDKGRGM